MALYPGRHEPIVDEKTFERSQAIRDLMSYHPRTRGDALERIYILSGILRCGYCGEPMQAHSSNDGVRYYRDKSQVQHLRDCPQQYVHADDVEAQVGQIVQSIELSPNWREEVVAAMHPDLDAEEIREREEAISARLERVQQLYIEGDIGRERYERERAECKARLSDLRPVGYDDIIAVGEFLQNASWDALTPLQKKKRSRTMFTTVLIRGTKLQAAKPTEAFYALIQHSAGLRQSTFQREEGYRNNGSDGIRTRDLRLDRPAC